MMGTLLYYDLRDTARFIGPLLLFNIFAILIAIIDSVSLFNNWVHLVSMLLIMISFALTAVVPPLVVLLRYYKTMYGEAAYLTHSFPLSAADKLNSKIALFFIWTIVQVLMLFTQAGIVSKIFTDQYAPDSMSLSIIISKTLREFLQQLNLSFIQLVGVIAALLVVAIIYIIFQAVYFFFIISLSVRIFGTRHVILGFITIIIAFQIIGTVLSSTLTMALPYATIINFADGLNIEWLAKVHPGSYFELFSHSSQQDAAVFPIINWILSVIYFAAFYGGTYYLLKRRISLN